MLTVKREATISAQGSGTLTIQGNLTVISGGTLSVNVNSAGKTSVIAVQARMGANSQVVQGSGTARLSTGSNVKVLRDPTFTPDNTFAPANF